MTISAIEAAKDPAHAIELFDTFWERAENHENPLEGAVGKKEILNRIFLRNKPLETRIPLARHILERGLTKDDLVLYRAAYNNWKEIYQLGREFGLEPTHDTLKAAILGKSAEMAKLVMDDGILPNTRILNLAALTRKNEAEILCALEERRVIPLSECNETAQRIYPLHNRAAYFGVLFNLAE